ncbi:MAG: hypothetical protein ACRCU5_04120 [Rhizobiaceae bacterium]
MRRSGFAIAALFSPAKCAGRVSMLKSTPIKTNLAKTTTKTV